jgi:hypothetical protein
MKSSGMIGIALLFVLSACEDSTNEAPPLTGSLRFDGSYGTFVSLPQVLGSNTQKFTVMFWFKVDSAFLHGGSDFTKLISFTEGSSTRFMFNLLPESFPASASYFMSGFNRLITEGSGDVQRFTQFSGDPPLANTWWHVALSITSSDGAPGNTDTSCMYINGNAVQQYRMADEPPYRFRIPVSSSDSIKVGVRTLGSIAHVAMYDRQLSLREIRERFKKMLTASEEEGLVGYWPMEKDVKDYSGNGRDGVLLGKGVFIGDSPF